MIRDWSSWKPFPDAHHGGYLDAPIGPGVYEVCHADTRKPVLFGYSPNVAMTLTKAVPDTRRRPFFRRPRYSSTELEYRTCAAGSLNEAKVAHDRRLGQRSRALRLFSPTAFD